MNLKIGIVGTNFISTNFCNAASQVEGIELFAVYSRREETGSAFASKNGIPHVFTDYDAFLSSGLDAVYVASPNFMHCPQTIKALQHKKHVLCEKVMALSEEEVLSMISCARENGVVLLEAIRPDFDPAYDLITRTLPQLGTLRRVSFEYCQYSSRYDDFKKGIVQNAFNPELKNAAVMDIGVYCIHSLVRLFGMPRSIKAVSTALENGFDGSGVILMDYDGMTAEAIYSKISVSVTPSVIQGENGSLLIDYVSRPETLRLCMREGSRDKLDNGNIRTLPYTPVENNMIYEIQEFLNLIKENNFSHKYLQYSLDTIRILDEVRRQIGFLIG